MFVPSFLALWWPKIDRKSGFRNFSRKLFLRFPNFLYQMQPRYLPYHDTLVGRVMPKFFSNKFFLNDSHQCSYHKDLKIGLFVGYFLMGWVLIRAGVYCPHLWAQLVGLCLPLLWFAQSVALAAQAGDTGIGLAMLMRPIKYQTKDTLFFIHVSQGKMKYQIEFSVNLKNYATVSHFLVFCCDYQHKS